MLIRPVDSTESNGDDIVDAEVVGKKYSKLFWTAWIFMGGLLGTMSIPLWVIVGRFDDFCTDDSVLTIQLTIGLLFHNAIASAIFVVTCAIYFFRKRKFLQCLLPFVVILLWWGNFWLVMKWTAVCEWGNLDALVWIAIAVLVVDVVILSCGSFYLAWRKKCCGFAKVIPYVIHFDHSPTERDIRETRTQEATLPEAQPVNVTVNDPVEDDLVPTLPIPYGGEENDQV